MVVCLQLKACAAVLCCLPTHPVKTLCRCAAWPAPDLQSRCTSCEDLQCAAVHTARAGECSARNYSPCVLYDIHADFHTCLWQSAGQSRCAVVLSATLRSHLTTVVASHDRGGGGGGLAHASLVSVVATAITVFVRKARITIVIPICVDQVHVVHGSNTSMYCTSPPSQDVNQKWQLTNVQTQNACMHVCVCMCVYACVRLRECLCVCVCARARSFTYMCGYVFLCAHGRRRTRLCAGMVT
jgi:hypothetical protein